MYGENQEIVIATYSFISHPSFESDAEDVEMRNGLYNV